MLIWAFVLNEHIFRIAQRWNVYIFKGGCADMIEKCQGEVCPNIRQQLSTLDCQDPGQGLSHGQQLSSAMCHSQVPNILSNKQRWLLTLVLETQWLH